MPRGKVESVIQFTPYPGTFIINPPPRGISFEEEEISSQSDEKKPEQKKAHFRYSGDVWVKYSDGNAHVRDGDLVPFLSKFRPITQYENPNVCYLYEIKIIDDAIVA